MSHLQRHPSNFFIFLLYTFSLTLSMKAFYRAVAASFAQEAQAQALGGLGTLAIIIYTGYTVPKPSMIGALRWFVKSSLLSPSRRGGGLYY